MKHDENPAIEVRELSEQKMISYVNKKGKAVGIQISPHARKRFSERWKVIFPNKSMDVPVDEEIEHWFRRTRRVSNLKRNEKKRLKRHGQDTLYFRTSHFTFVVQDGVLRTIELSDTQMRHCNNKLPQLALANKPRQKLARLAAEIHL